MSTPSDSPHRYRQVEFRLKLMGWTLLLFWTLVVGAVLLWDMERGEAETRERAIVEARAHYNKDVAFRLWGTDHGVIYVPEGPRMTPDPNLAQLPERDIVTPSGRRLTLINPARIIRQLNEEYGDLYGVAGRITSLKPLRAENAPDAWERQALQSFERGVTEVLEFTEVDGEPYLRLMRPLMVKPGCLLCHAGQGFVVGGVSGGVGVAVPLSGLMMRQQQRLIADAVLLGIFWVAGAILLFFVFRRLQRDQQQRNHAMEELCRSEMRKGAIMDSALDCIITMDHEGRIVEFNPAAERVFGYRRDEVVGLELCQVLIPPSLRALHRQGLERHLEKGSRTLLGRRVETTAMRSDGSEFPVELAITRVEIEGNPLFTATLRDITQTRQMADQISFQSTHDGLTGMLNRYEFERRLGLSLEGMGLADGEHAVFYLDLDQFKVINDTWGHGAGDELLCLIAKLLQSRMRAGDVLARLGGDEFGILLEHCPLDKAEQVGRDLLRAIQESRFEWQGVNFNLTASLGIVQVHSREQTLSDVLSAADTACFVAKEQGRNRVHLFRHDDVELARRQGEMRWVGRIHDAFSEGRFFLYQQAIQPLSREGGERRRHYEILTRMRDEAGEFVSPAVFLSAAERFSLMPTIDRWVVRSVFAWLEAHPAHVTALELCSINLSGHSVTDDTFLQFLDEKLAVSPVPAACICFEITETAAVSNLSKAVRFMEVIRQRGCSFALDDFGSGMSSFAYLKNLPVDYLKIDGSFVRDMLEDEIDFAMARSINEIGHVMGKKTIAEFVESEGILRRLQDIGVDYGQGYAIARPAPLDDMLGDGGEVIDRAG